MRLLRCVLLLLSVDWALSARILSILPMSAKSHHIFLQAILKTLAQRGHQVVNYSVYPLDKPMANYRDVLLEGMETIEQALTPELLDRLLNQSQTRPVQFLWNHKPHMGEKALKTDQIKALMKSDEKYDLIILEPLLAQEVLLYFGYKFNAPVIGIQPFGAFSLVNKVMGNSLSLSYIPDYSFPFSDHMSFYERCLNAYSILSTIGEYYLKYLPTQEELMKVYFKDPNIPPLMDMIHNISLFINNAHPNIQYPQPSTPNIIPIGGIHLGKSKENKLPMDMKVFLDEAKHGVIYFSLGSVVPDHMLPDSYFSNFIHVFRQLPQRVLWKTKHNFTSLPENTLTATWVPQQDVLAHPNMELFITHGGLFSQHEAIHAGVPVVCIPFFGDQPFNARFYEEKGIGVRLPFKSLTKETIQKALSTVLSDPRYKTNMQSLSRVYKDQPLSQADSLLFWVEYVLRHRGAPHLRPQASRLSWYQLALLDVLGVILVTATSVVLALYLSLRTVILFVKDKLRPNNTLNERKTK